MFTVNLFPATLENLIQPGRKFPTHLLVAGSEKREYFDDVEGELRVEIHSHYFTQDVIHYGLYAAGVLPVEYILGRSNDQ